MAMHHDDHLNKMASDEYNSSNPETRLRDYFAEIPSVQERNFQDATVFMMNPHQVEGNPDLADINIPEEVDKFNDIFAELLMAMQAQPEMSLTEMIQRVVTGQSVAMSDKAKQTIQAYMHATSKLLEKLQAMQFARGKGGSKGMSIS